MSYRIIKELPTEEALKKIAARYPEANVPALMAVTRLIGTASELEKCLEMYLSDFGISLSRFYVLSIIRRYMPEGLKATDIAEKIATTRGNMTGLLDGLETSGLITRCDCENDRRISYIRISGEGEKLLDRILPEHFRRINSVMGLLGDAELQRMTQNLEKVRASVIQLNASMKPS